MVRIPESQGAAAKIITEQGTRRSRSERRRRFGGRQTAEEGSIAMEFVGLLPMMLLILVVCWQVGVTAISSVWANSAATAASHAAAAGVDPGPAAMDRVPSAFRGNVTVTPYAASGLVDGQVTVSVRVPLVAPGLQTPWQMVVSRKVVPEP